MILASTWSRACRSSLSVWELLEAPKQIGSFYKLPIKRERQKQVPKKLLKSSQVPKEAPIKKGTFRTSSQAPRSGEMSGMGYQNPGSGTWWENYGGCVPILQKLAIRVLNQTCSSSDCKRNWSGFEKVHSKKRNKLENFKLIINY